MPKINENELKSCIKREDFSNVYFIFGKEVLLCQYYADLIAKKSVSSELASFNLARLNGVDHTVDSVISSAMSMPVMAEKRCLVLCDFDIPALEKSDREKLMDIISNPYEQTVLVLWFNGVELYSRKPDGSFTSNLKSDWKKIVDVVMESGSVLEISGTTEHDTEKRIYNNAVRRGRKIDRDAIESLYSLVGNDTLTLSNELDKLAAYCDSGTITKDAVNKLVMKTTENNIYRIATAINKHDGDTAYSEIRNLMTQNISPELIIGTMASEYITAYYVNQLKKFGKTRSEIVKLLKSTDFQIKKADDLSYHLGEKALMQIINELSAADDKIKLRSNLDSKTILETLAAQLLLITSRA